MVITLPVNTRRISGRWLGEKIKIKMANKKEGIPKDLRNFSLEMRELCFLGLKEEGKATVRQSDFKKRQFYK